MKAFKHLVGLIILGFTLSCFNIEAFELLRPSNERYLKYNQTDRISLTGLGGESYGCEKRWATLEFFTAPSICNEEIIPFIDLKGHFLDSSKWAANAGVGVRWVTCCNRRVTGFNVYYDYRQGCRGEYNQVGMGFESLGLNFDIRINGYMPIGKTIFTNTRMFNDYIGPFVITCKRKEYAMPGADLEIGRYVDPCSSYMLYTALGGYYYYKNHFSHFLGVVGRIKIQYNEYLSLEVKASYDKACHGKLQGALQLTIPFEVFGCAYRMPESVCRGLFLQPVHRKDVLVTDVCQKWITNF
jgi:hypothetical protein